ncbi:ABC transporter substrate-binding protein [Variovorax ureilyticus]|uniref:ABC transporter substrate-binding protein n=1 Tax=Variovorax ureilyticus TaxID=1836198 RepID=A0ABU8VM27_9BURK
MQRRQLLVAGAAGAAMSFPPFLRAQSKESPGVTDTEIRLGQTNPYSGPLSAYAAWFGKVQLAYCNFVNDQGGINGRKIKLLSYDDGYQPPRTVEQVRKLVESDGIAAVLHIFGTAPNRAVVRYLNTKKIPQIFCGTSGDGFADPKTQPYTMPFQPTARIEAQIFGKYMLQDLKGKKIGILYQQDEIGASVRQGLREGLGAGNEKLIVSEQSYQPSDTTVDSQVLNLKASGAEIFYNSATLKHCAMAVKKAQEVGWQPTIFTLNTTSAVNKVLKESGSGLPEGSLTSIWHKSPVDPAWANDPAMVEWKGFMKKYYPEGDASEPNCVLSTCYAQAMFHVLKSCGNDLRSENILNVARNLKSVQLPLLLPGITLNTSPTDYYPIKQLQLTHIEKGDWKSFGQVLSA